MNENEDMSLLDEEIDYSDPGDENDSDVQDPDPSIERLERLESMISQLAAKMDKPQEEPDDDWESDMAKRVAETVAARFDQRMEPILRKTAVESLIDDVAPGADGTARKKLEEYLGNYTVDGLKALAADKQTREILQGYVRSLGTSQSKAPTTNKAGGSVEPGISAYEREIHMFATATADSLGISYEDARKQLEADYKEALKNA